MLCAVSGGADSMAMLHMLRALETQLEISLCCAHYHHGIRGAEADRDEEFVRGVCARLEIPFVSGRGDVPAWAAEQGMGLEEAARPLRYAVLRSTAAELGCARIATAHNAADNAETMLMNLLWGSGLRGACGIPPVRGSIVRPLLCLDRPQIEAYLLENRIPWVTDSTNLTEDCTRNRLRRRVIAPLRELDPDFGEKLLGSCLSMRADEQYLQSLAENFLAGQEESISAAALTALPEPVAARVIRTLAPGASRGHVQAVRTLAAGEKLHGALDLPGLRVLRQYDRLLFGAPGPEALSEQVLTPGESLRGGRYTLSCTLDEARKNTRGPAQVFCFKTTEICGKITVGPRRPGDRIRLAGRGMTRPLKKLLSEARIPPTERERIPVLRDERGVLALYGFGQDERAAAGSGQRALMIEIKIDSEE